MSVHTAGATLSFGNGLLLMCVIGKKTNNSIFTKFSVVVLFGKY